MAMDSTRTTTTTPHAHRANQHVRHRQPGMGSAGKSGLAAGAARLGRPSGGWSGAAQLVGAQWGGVGSRFTMT
eukprot:12906297-Prorocentrum_lima.AAC.1